MLSSSPVKAEARQKANARLADIIAENSFFSVISIADIHGDYVASASPSTHIGKINVADRAYFSKLPWEGKQP